MHFNVDKCSVMHCGFQNKKKNYKLYGNILRKTTCEKDLGILVNPDMKFKDQVSAASKKANKILGMIKRNFECMNQEMFQILYDTLVRSHLEYAVTVWSPYQQEQKIYLKKYREERPR